MTPLTAADPRIRRQPLMVPSTTARAYVTFESVEIGPDDRCELVFRVQHSTKFSTARIRALPLEQAEALYHALGAALRPIGNG